MYGINANPVDKEVYTFLLLLESCELITFIWPIRIIMLWHENFVLFTGILYGEAIIHSPVDSLSQTTRMLSFDGSLLTTTNRGMNTQAARDLRRHGAHVTR